MAIIGRLFPASFRGVPFLVERSGQSVGKRIARHQYPFRDAPYLEELGEDISSYQVSAYVASDVAEVQARAVLGVCAAKGAGLLVLPDIGAVMVQCLRASRDFSRDEQGYVALNLEFLREGASSSAAGGGSLAAAANAIVLAAQGVSSLLSALLAGQAYFAGASSRVVEETLAAVTGIAAYADVTIASFSLPEEDSSAAMVGLTQAVAGISTASSSAAGLAPAPLAALVDTLIEASIAAAPDIALSALAEMWEGLPLTVDPARAAAVVSAGPAAARPGDGFQTRDEARIAFNRALVVRVSRAAALFAMAAALTEKTFASRPEGIAARAAFAERAEIDMRACLGAADAALYSALLDLQGKVSDYLSRLIADLAPVLTIEARASLPALTVAWRLYAAPQRYGELAARNRVAHPGFLPPVFEALAS